MARRPAADRRRTRLARARQARRAFLPGMQPLERRTLMVAGAFLQGTAYLDLNANNQLDQQEPYLVGATVKLYSSDGSTLLGRQVTDANGYYRFDDSDVVGSNLQPGTYRIVETPPAGVVNTGAQLLSNMDSGSVLAPNAAQVTLISPANLSLTLNGSGAGENVTVVGNGTSEATYAGQLKLTLTQSGATVAQFVANCVDLFHGVNYGDTFAVLPREVGSAFAAHGGQMAYLYNHYGQSTTLTAAQAAGLQLALWELEVDPVTNLNAGNFQATSPGVDAAAVAAANAYLAESVNKSESALYLDATLGGQSVPGTGRQGMIASGSVNFANVALASVSGFAYDDANNDGRKQAAEPGVAGAGLALVGADLWGRPVDLTATTAADGSYDFPHLYPGTYSLLETPPAGAIDGQVTAGAAGGVAGRRAITGVALGSGVGATNYDFGFDRPPAFASTAPDQVVAGQPYAYAARATDPDADTLTYSLIAGPAGMGVTAAGQVSWTPPASGSPGAVGTHPIRLGVGDGRGGAAEQDFTLTVLPPGLYPPPHYITTPVVDAYVGMPYAYPSAAADPDGDPLQFSLTSGPAGLAYNASGLVAWTPTVQQLGPNRVALRVADQHGGYDVQIYNIKVHPQAGSANAIHIVSTPVTSYQFAQGTGGATVLDATIHDVPMTFPDV